MLLASVGRYTDAPLYLLSKQTVHLSLSPPCAASSISKNKLCIKLRRKRLGLTCSYQE